MTVATISPSAEAIDFANDYSVKFGRVILAYERPNVFLTTHGRVSTEQLVDDVSRLYRHRDINPIAVVAAVAETFLQDDREACSKKDARLATCGKAILHRTIFEDDVSMVVDAVRRGYWRKESTSRLYARLCSYSNEQYQLYKDEIDAVRDELARRNVTQASWGRRAPPISFN